MIEISIKVKLLRKFLRRPYGEAKFKLGKNIYTKMIRFDKDSIKTDNGMWIFDKGKIYVERGGVKADKDTEGKKIVDFIAWQEGYPIIYLDQNDMIPLHFQNEKYDGVRSPKNVQAVIGKEVSASEAEIMRKTRSKIELYVKVAVVVGVLAFIAAYFGVQQVLELKDMVAAIPIYTGPGPPL